MRAISGYCMGGGLDLALACQHRIASPHAVFGHRGAALGLITGWGGTQRLPRLVGKGAALEMFVAAEKLNASAGAADRVWTRSPTIRLRKRCRSNSETFADRRIADCTPALRAFSPRWYTVISPLFDSWLTVTNLWP